jgi:hypothetical protein
MTTNQIFEANQVLTLAIAKKLIGKVIAITNCEYKGNRPSVRKFKLTAIISEYEVARQTKVTGYESQADYWEKMVPEAVKRGKSHMVLIGEGDKPYATCRVVGGYYPEPTFHGSDEDREIYYLVCDDN